MALVQVLLHHSRSWNRMRTGHRHTIGSSRPTSGRNACLDKCAHRRFKQNDKTRSVYTAIVSWNM